MRSKGCSTMFVRVSSTVSSMRWLKKAMSSGQLSSTSLVTSFRNASARSMLPWMSQKAISGSTIQNSARWRLVLEFSERNVGPKV